MNKNKKLENEAEIAISSKVGEEEKVNRTKKKLLVK